MTAFTQFNQAPYLRIQRQFPNEDLRALANQVDHAYIDIADKVNSRIIGTFPVNVSVITGERWFLSGQPNSQQTLRQVYPFTGAGTIPHGVTNFMFFTRCWGEYTDGTKYYGAIWANGAITGQITFNMDATNIYITVDGAAPAITSGNIILEWLSQY